MKVFKKIVQFLKEVRAELKKVTWPTRKQALFYTAVVVGLSLFVALFLGAFDFIFMKIMEFVLAKIK